ncbi:MAG: translation initiation factor IF-2 subunit alpha [Candidatus Thorarchaeota archaeon]
MVLRRAEWPQVDDFAIAVATKVTSYGAYVTLPEYNNKEGFIHISEISSTWVRNIRNHIHENQRVVVKILQVDPEKGQIDCSLRRVSAEAARAKNNEWKRAQKAERILEQLASDSNMTLQETYRAVGWPLEDHFGEIYTALEKIAVEGEAALVSVDIPRELRARLIELARSRIETPSVELDGELNIQVPGIDGVEVIKKALLAGLSVAKNNRSSTVDIYTLGSPRYKLRITGPDYKEAESVLSAVVEAVSGIVRAQGGVVSLTRK